MIVTLGKDDDMKICNLDQTEVVEAAKVHFAPKVVAYDQVDFYLPDIETGKIMVEGVDHPMYVSTHYAYEDHIVKGNDTRYKVPLSMIYVKDDAYDVIYDSRDCCYIAYEEANEIKFILYVDFYAFIKPYIHLEE